MVLVKSSVHLSQFYDRELVPPELHFIGGQLRTLFDETVQIILQITGEPFLIAHDKVLQRAVNNRAPYTDPINILQVKCLKMYRAGVESAPIKDALLMSIQGVSAGMQNTG